MELNASSSKRTRPIPPLPPLSLPVWSLAAPIGTTTRDNVSSSTSMNIVTFTSAVSVAEPKYWMISLYYDTLTKDSFCESKEGVLQLLTPQQRELVPILGKRSGYEGGYSKEEACYKVGIPWVESREFLGEPHSGTPVLHLLPECASYLHVRMESAVDAGDHLVTICKLLSTGVWDNKSKTVKCRTPETTGASVAMDHRNVLYTEQLREEGII
eukprot:scaffold3058_cov177-Amphora_coffeaeformis.AAC.4